MTDSISWTSSVPFVVLRAESFHKALRKVPYVTGFRLFLVQRRIDRPAVGPFQLHPCASQMVTGAVEKGRIIISGKAASGIRNEVRKRGLSRTLRPNYRDKAGVQQQCAVFEPLVRISDRNGCEDPRPIMIVRARGADVNAVLGLKQNLS